MRPSRALAVAFSALTLAAAQDPAHRVRKVAVLIHDGVELLDFAGPVEVFSAAGRHRAFKVFTVAPDKKPITSHGPLVVTPQYSLADCPEADVIVVPGGESNVLTSDPRVLDWIRTRAPKAERVVSVCTGAFVLADAGLLGGLEITTHWSGIAALRRAVPTATVREGVRFCSNGRIVTAAGVAAGIDAALHVVSEICGVEVAQRTARYMEYPWQPPAAPASQPASAPSSRERAGYQAFLLGDHAQAAAVYRELTAVHPGEAHVWARAGACDFQARRHADAVANLRKAVALDASDADTHVLLAWSLLQLQQAQEAIPHFETAIARGRGDADVWIGLASARAAAGQPEPALDALDQAVQRGAPVQRALATTELAALRGEPRFATLLRTRAPERRLNLVPAGEPGTKLILGAKVVERGQPVAGALVHVFHADANGHYAAGDAPMSEQRARLAAWVRTAPDGSFEIRTIRPAGYPPSVSGLRPAHVHLEVTAGSGKARHVHVFFEDDERLTPQLRERMLAEGQLVAAVTKDDAGIQRVSVTIDLD